MFAERRVMPAWPASSIGGFHSTKYFRPRGAPSLSISSIARPVSLAVNSAGLAIVADEQITRGREP